jgi:glycosyltransferase involved in cell wall biosynthesis
MRIDMRQNYTAASIVLTSYNRQEGLIKAFHSCVNQVYPYYELIIIDDGSAFDVRKVLEESITCEEERNWFLKALIVNLPHTGNIGLVRNFGLTLCKGSNVVFLSDDGELSEIYLNVMMDAATNSPEPDLVICRSPDLSPMFHKFNNSTYRILKNGVAQKISAGNVLFRTYSLLRTGWSLDMTEAYLTNVTISSMLSHPMRVVSVPTNLYIHNHLSDGHSEATLKSKQLGLNIHE